MASKAFVSLLALAGAAAAADLPSIVNKGSRLFYPNGTQFFMKGVAYQQDVAPAGASGSSTVSDPLADPTACQRDIPLLAELGTNVIRTYSINPNADHSQCMQLLQENGIYVISDLGNPTVSINRADPQWNTQLFAHYQSVVDELSQYSNVIGFFAGNEVSNNATNTGASAYVKAAVRDTKAYIQQKGYRWMGVGYAANDDVDIRRQIADYFNCGNQSSAIDFWGYNIYSWCGNSNFATSGYNDDLEFFSNYSAPVFFAEYGCNTVPGGAAGRKFTETAALYAPNMTKVFTGGIVFMYFEETNDFGLVDISSSGQATKLADFSALQQEVAAAHPVGEEDMSSYSPTNQPADCPAVDSTWQASNTLPPMPDLGLCNCMSSAAKCVRKPSLQATDFGDIFNFICSAVPSACAGIAGNSTTGVYGAYSMCEPGAQLDYVLNEYYISQKSASTACDFKGQAMVQAGSVASNCSSALASASSQNAQVATQTSASPASSSTSAGDDGDNFGVPGASITRVFAFGDAAVGLYVIVAGIVGAGMVML